MSLIFYLEKQWSCKPGYVAAAPLRGSVACHLSVWKVLPLQYSSLPLGNGRATLRCRYT